MFFKGDKSKLAYVTQLLVVKLLMVERLIWFLRSSISAFCHGIRFCINSNFMAISNKMLWKDIKMALWKRQCKLLNDLFLVGRFCVITSENDSISYQWNVQTLTCEPKRKWLQRFELGSFENNESFGLQIFLSSRDDLWWYGARLSQSNARERELSERRQFMTTTTRFDRPLWWLSNKRVVFHPFQ